LVAFVNLEIRSPGPIGWDFLFWFGLRNSGYCFARGGGTKIDLKHLGKNIRRKEMPKNSLRELYIDELRDLYNAETQLVKALPKMARASSSGRLREAFEEHLRQTSEHVSRLEEIFEQMEEKPTGKKCLAMDGLVKEGAETMKEDYDGEVMDAAIIGAAQRVEHYEIAGYGTVRDFAKILGEDEHVSLLEQTLDEEKQADKNLTELAVEINPLAAGNAGEEEVEQGENIESRANQRNAAKSRRVA
jgi:ferritin-like metal-binding protein YciE